MRLNAVRRSFLEGQVFPSDEARKIEDVPALTRKPNSDRSMDKSPWRGCSVLYGSFIAGGRGASLGGSARFTLTMPG